MAGVAAISLGGAIPEPSQAALPAAPFAVLVAVSPDGVGNSITVSVEPRPGQAPDAKDPFDLYIGLLQGFQEALFLTASGSWSRRPASLRQGLSMRDLAPVTVRWSERRFGSMHLLVIAARPSSDPFVQSSWLFRPVLRTVDVRARLADAPDRWQASLTLGGLGLLTLVVIGVVLGLPRPRRSEPAETSGAG